MGNTNNKINKYPHISIQFPFINDFIFMNIFASIQ